MKNYAILLAVCLFLFINYTHSQTWTNYTKVDGLLSNGVCSVTIDAQGNKWFGTHFGVSKFDDTTWTTYDASNSRNLDAVTDIAIDKQGHIVIAAAVGVSEFDGTTWKTYRAEKDSGYVCLIESVAIDTLNNKWFGTDGCGFLKFDGTTWSNYTWSNDLTLDSLRPPWCIVAAIAIDAQGNIWYSCHACGLIAYEENIPAYLVKYDGTTWTKYTTSEYLYNQICAIAIDHHGNLWVGTGGGLFKFDGENWTKYTTADGLASNWITAIAIDPQGNKWFGTEVGVSKFDGTTWTTYKNSFGWEQNYIYDMAIDNQGNIWLGTHGGVVKLSAEGSIGIPMLTNKNHLNLYPNPIKDIGTFEFENDNTLKVYLEIFDFSGRLIGNKTSSDEKIEFDFSNYSSGIYFYKLRNSEGIIGAGKIVKE